jgi:membrane-bound lytic murein transglycosylase B
VPTTRARSTVLEIAVTVGALAALVLTGLAAFGPVRREAWTAPAVPASVGMTAHVPAATELVSLPVSLDATTPAPEGAGARASARWVASVAGTTGIPAPAAQAYGDASLALATEAPTCHLGWTTLAALGAIESAHGSHGDSVLQTDGRSVPPIIGPTLDGNGFAAIRATAVSTALHGDPTWDHAVGPMQFIPSTWERWGADGDGDGRADPQDIDDAVLAAARYLCAGGRDLTVASGWQAAVLSYNHSQEYVDRVLGIADGYALTAP